MNRGFPVAVLACVICLLTARADGAEPAGNPISPVSTEASPPKPVLRSPIRFFRSLLDLTPAERTKHLADRTPESRAVILAKLKEYEALPVNLRELRLRATELSWYLQHLLPVPPSERAALVESIPATDRPLVKSRLAYWDSLPRAQQQSLLDNDSALRILARITPSSSAAPSTPGGFLDHISPGRGSKLEQDLARLQQLSPAERERVLQQFRLLYGLTASPRPPHPMEGLAKGERQQLERARQFVKELPPAQRQEYIGAVRKFAEMTPAQKARFVQGARRWKELSQEERAAWRTVTKSLPPLPPLPPGFSPHSSIMPPGGASPTAFKLTNTP